MTHYFCQTLTIFGEKKFLRNLAVLNYFHVCSKIHQSIPLRIKMSKLSPRYIEYFKPPFIDIIDLDV